MCIANGYSILVPRYGQVPGIFKNRKLPRHPPPTCRIRYIDWQKTNTAKSGHQGGSTTRQATEKPTDRPPAGTGSHFLLILSHCVAFLLSDAVGLAGLTPAAPVPVHSSIPADYPIEAPSPTSMPLSQLTQSWAWRSGISPSRIGEGGETSVFLR